MKISLQRALFAFVALALVAGLVPAGIVLDRWLAAALEGRAREDLVLAPQLFADREATRADALMMRAKDLAATPGLADAMARNDRPTALRLAEEVQSAVEGNVILFGSDGEPWTRVQRVPDLLEETRAGHSPVALVADEQHLRKLALAPVKLEGRWIGAAGIATLLDRAAAGDLAGLTRSEVVILRSDREVAATTAEEDVTAVIAANAVVAEEAGAVREVRTAGGRRYLLTTAPLNGEIGYVAFARDLDAELAILPRLRRIAAVAALSALVIALVLGTAAATFLTRPVRALAHAADRLAAGDFEPPLERSAVREIDRVALAFDEMRRALAARLREVESANRELADRQQRLTALQAELIQRDRLAASGRLVTELAHEIRNPVANVRNCLEVIRRRVSDDETGREFADLAIDELLRMHELAERMLDLNRPRDPDTRDCDAADVADEVAALVRAGAGGEPLRIELESRGETRVSVPPDALKQVLLNLVQNAREAIGDDGTIELSVRAEDSVVVVDVVDDGPGIPEEILPKVFDPFFTTKAGVHGVGLGLFVAEGIIRTYGGRITVANDDLMSGARFHIEIPAADRRAGFSKDDRVGTGTKARE